MSLQVVVDRVQRMGRATAMFFTRDEIVKCVDDARRLAEDARTFRARVLGLEREVDAERASTAGLKADRDAAVAAAEQLVLDKQALEKTIEELKADIAALHQHGSDGH